VLCKGACPPLKSAPSRGGLYPCNICFPRPCVTPNRLAIGSAVFAQRSCCRTHKPRSSDISSNGPRLCMQRVRHSRDDNGHTFSPLTHHVTHQSIDRVTRDSRLLTSHDSRLLQFPVRTAKWKCSRNQTSSLPQNTP